MEGVSRLARVDADFVASVHADSVGFGRDSVGFGASFRADSVDFIAKTRLHFVDSVASMPEATPKTRHKKARFPVLEIGLGPTARCRAFLCFR